MESFTVTAVIDANTFEVSPVWVYGDESGEKVQATGYDPPKSGKSGLAAEQKLSVLIQNKKVELDSPHGIERGRLICDVYFEGVNLAHHFSEYSQKQEVSEQAEEDAAEDFEEVPPGSVEE